jgi:hypothetical protein
MVLGEQFGGWIITKKVSVAHAASVCLVEKHRGPEPHVQPVTSAELARTEK